MKVCDNLHYYANYLREKMSMDSMEIKRIIHQIKRYMKQHKHSQNKASEISGVHQSQICRILNGKCRRISKSVIKLCEYAKLENQDTEADPSQNPELMNALRIAWDGTTNSAKTLSRIILAVAEMREQERL